jgi:predicted ATPase/DNA-binding SARP family transcriptional activator
VPLAPLDNRIVVRLSLTFLNTFQATLDSQPITRFRSNNNRGLLVYLALQNERSFSREVLATLLWPEESDNDARNNLRQSLYQLRKVLGDLDNAGEPYLLVTRQTVQFNPDSNFILDVKQFYRAIETGDLETAASHYHGELLPGFTCDSVQVEDWLRQEREHLHQVALKAMFELTQNYLQDGRLEKAQSTARRQLSLEPWREQAYCQLMQAYALAGDRGSALAQFEVCREVLWDELAVEPTAETVAIYENIKAGNYGPIAAVESLRSPVEHRHNLPVYATPFIGRKAELEKLDAYIADPSVRLVTIVGPGGIGKTRLGITAAERALASQIFPEGLFFIDLAPLQEVSRIVQAVADALNFPLQGGEGHSRQQLLDYLRQKKMLFFFDNFEHLLDGADLVADMLQAGPEVMILVTSRERLNLLAEQLYPIEGLEFPDWETPEDAAEYTAVRLFLQSARRNQPEFAIRDDEDLTYLARICRMVAGMPLALELAACWVDKLTLEEIASELQRGVGILESELRDLPERQRSVRASFDYSWRRLDDADQVVFAQLSIFRGGFTRQAAQQVTGATLHGLSRLVNKSLVRFDKQRGRYEVHELLRQYGADKLGRKSTLEAATRDRHSKYYCQLLAGYTDDLKGAGKAQALSAIDADIENVWLAWNHASTQQDLAALSKSYESLWRFYHDYGRAEVSIFEKAVADLRTGKAIGARGIVLGQLLAPLGRFYAMAGDTAKAREILEESLDLLQRLEASEERLMPLLFLAEVQGSIEESNRLYQEGLDLARALGDQWAIGHALVFMGWNARLKGDYQVAEQQGREALKQFRQNSDTGGVVFTLNLLSLLAIDGGRYEEAVALAREAISLSQGFNPVFRLMGSGPLGVALHALGKYEEAEEQFKQGFTVFGEFGREDWEGWLFWLGKIAFAKKDYARATQQFQESLAKAVVRDNQAWVIQIHDALGRVDIAQGRGLEARKHFRAALETALTIDHRPLLLECLTSIAELFAQEGDLDYAVTLATLTTSDPSSQAMIKERGARILNRIAADLSPHELDSVRQRIWQSDLGILTAQLLVDLEIP